MCTVHACTMFLYAQIDTHKAAHMDAFVCVCVCVCVCVRLCTSVFIGLCAKRGSNLIAIQRVSTCDSRDIQTLDQYLDRLSDNDSSGRYGQLLQYVCFPGWCADSLAKSHHPQFNVPKAKYGPVSAWTDCSRPLRSLPQRSLCPLTTLTGAVRLISQCPLITWNQTLKEGGSWSYS